jgi:predicted  nucleic acid-binding Zn-ribbon protein
METQTTEKVLTLVVQGREKPVALACGKCGTVYGLGDESGAARCCEPYQCSECGTETRRYHTICDSCRGARRREREREQFEAATVIPFDARAGEMLYDEEHDRWITDFEDAEDSDPPTRYAYATTPRRLSMDAGQTIEDAIEGGEHHEGAYDEVSDAETAELQAFLDGWCERTGIVSHLPDYSRVVLFDPKLARATPTTEAPGE